MHNNLFSQGHSRREVKDALNRDHRRDSIVIKSLDFMLGVCILYLVRGMAPLDAAAIVIAIVAGLSGMRHFIDQSARNFFLHRLDWEESAPNP